MTKRRKPVKLTAAKLARTAARARIGPVPPTRPVPDKRKREKYKPDFERSES
ncbi:MAG TPA: hypothetical protein VN515_04605 [Terriglobales bacterium]|nr:hypothetical protein [Terriglobales bacterium]